MKQLPRRNMVHQLKTVQPYFDDVASGNKTFEVRKNDRDFKVNDVLMLLEYEPDKADNQKSKGLTGKCVTARITYILDTPKYCKDGYVILGFRPEKMLSSNK